LINNLYVKTVEMKEKVIIALRGYILKIHS